MGNWNFFSRLEINRPALLSNHIDIANNRHSDPLDIKFYPALDRQCGIVLEGLRGEESIAELCRREGISLSLYYRCGKEFLEAGKQRLVGNTKWEASSEDVKSLRSENEQLKQLVAGLAPKNRVLGQTQSRLP